MALLQDRSVSFVVRIWREPSGPEGVAGEWRGMIQPVGAEKPHFFRDLQGMFEFMRPFFDDLQIDPNERFWDWVAPWDREMAGGEGLDPSRGRAQEED